MGFVILHPFKLDETAVLYRQKTILTEAREDNIPDGKFGINGRLYGCSSKTFLSFFIFHEKRFTDIEDAISFVKLLPSNEDFFLIIPPPSGYEVRLNFPSSSRHFQYIPYMKSPESKELLKKHLKHLLLAKMGKKKVRYIMTMKEYAEWTLPFLKSLAKDREFAVLRSYNSVYNHQLSSEYICKSILSKEMMKQHLTSIFRQKGEIVFVGKTDVGIDGTPKPNFGKLLEKIVYPSSLLYKNGEIDFEKYTSHPSFRVSRHTFLKRK